MTAQDHLKFMEESVAAIRLRMAGAARAAGRDPAEVLLCAACKTQTVETVRQSAALPIDLFGENHVQELVEKADAGAYCGKPAHFIGHLQTNKLKKVLGRAELIQSVDSPRLLDAIEKEAAKRQLVQDVLLEVNIGAEEGKTGIAEAELPALLEAAAAKAHIRVRGLMAIPPADASREENCGYFRQVHALYVDINTKLFHNDFKYLSMGMSGDYEDAIRFGATMVRVGSAIFGARHYT